MKPVRVVAAAALSALGRGRAAYDTGRVGEPAPSGLRLYEQSDDVCLPLFGRVSDAELGAGDDRAARLVHAVASDLCAELDLKCRGWRQQRIGLILGTSAGAMQSLQSAFALRSRGERLSLELARAANYFSAFLSFTEVLALERQPVCQVQILAACASATVAVGLGCRWLEQGICELVIAGGYDALSSLVSSGFDALGALTHSRPQPFRAQRDGMALGEGAALLALGLADAHPTGLGQVLGFAATADAFHVTAPDPNGTGLARAAAAALEDADLAPAQVSLVSAHATATALNDVAEVQALRHVFSTRDVLLHAWKSSIGHTLGAAGVLESLAAFDAMERGVLPASLGDGELAPELAGRLAPLNEAGQPTRCLKLSAAFGGCNAALVLGSDRVAGAGSARGVRQVGLVATGELVDAADPDLVARIGPAAAAAVARSDSLSALVLTAAARLLEGQSFELPQGTAVIVGTSCATIELDEVFDSRRRAGLAVFPRKFPATSPNLCASVCAIALSLHGPAFSVGGGLCAHSEALAVGYDLVRAGDAPAALVIGAEDVGPVVTDIFRTAEQRVPGRGAQALLLAADHGPAVPASVMDDCRAGRGLPSLAEILAVIASETLASAG